MKFEMLAPLKQQQQVVMEASLDHQDVLKPKKFILVETKVSSFRS